MAHKDTQTYKNPSNSNKKYPENIFFYIFQETLHAVQLMHLQWPASSQPVVLWRESYRPLVWMWAP